jgi:hypothetical protein
MQQKIFPKEFSIQSFLNELKTKFSATKFSGMKIIFNDIETECVCVSLMQQ